MDATRRDFLAAAAAAGAGSLLPASTRAQPATDTAPAPAPQRLPAEAIDEDMIAGAERLAGIEFTGQERAQMVRTLGQQAERYRARLRAGFLPNTLSPAQTFDPRLPGMEFAQEQAPIVRSAAARPLPSDDDAIAFAPLTDLSRWIERRAISSARLTSIYLDRLRRIDPKIRAVITLTEEHARARASAADAEIAAGRYRGPLHGVPYGAKDLFDTAGIRTTWGAEPWRDRVPDSDASVIRRLDDAGAVLIAKTSLGALAYGDRWLDQRTNNPWNLERGSSGSSAGSAAGTAAGCFGFSIGTETYGSIMSPSMACGTTGLRPTFGRVSRAGAMALCWSLDKVGPICRTVEDAALVLSVLNGGDPGDPSSVSMPFNFDATMDVRPVRVGFSPAWFEGRRAHDIDRAALEALRSLGVNMVEIDLPEWPYGSLLTILSVEAAAAFEEMTRTDADDQLSWQDDQAWPNSFRETWFVPAIELVQADRLRRRVMGMMAERFDAVDLIFAPSQAANLCLITNMTGHPQLTLRAGFREDGTPRGVTLWGRLYNEGTLCAAGMALEQALGVWDRRPSV